jgi:hypothetical protein
MATSHHPNYGALPMDNLGNRIDESVITPITPSAFAGEHGNRNCLMSYQEVDDLQTIQYSVLGRFGDHLMDRILPVDHHLKLLLIAPSDPGP